MGLKMALHMKGFQKNLYGIYNHGKWNFRPTSSSIFHFEHKVWISDILSVKVLPNKWNDDQNNNLYAL